MVRKGKGEDQSVGVALSRILLDRQETAASSFFIKYTKDLRIFIIKIEENNHTNNMLFGSALGGQHEKPKLTVLEYNRLQLHLHVGISSWYTNGQQRQGK